MSIANAIGGSILGKIGNTLGTVLNPAEWVDAAHTPDPARGESNEQYAMRGTAPNAQDPNAYRGYNPGATVPGLLRGMQGGYGVSQGMGGAAMPVAQSGGYSQVSGQGNNGIQQQLAAIQSALTGQGGMGV